MFFICPGCGEWSTERTVEGSVVVCECGYRNPIAVRPLLLVTGASGAGKSTIARHLTGTFTDVVVLDQDVLWMPEMNTPDDNYRRFRSLWLRLAIDSAQSGRPLLLFGSCDPDQYEGLPERRYVGPIHTLALVCDDQELRDRLSARPAWRQSGGEDFIGEMIHFNRALRSLAIERPQSVTLLDTTHVDSAESALQVAAWARAALKGALSTETV